MIPNDRAFNGKLYYEYDGKIFYRSYYIKKIGDYKIKIKFISTNSKNLQGIALFFGDFKGTILVNEEKLPILKGFQHYSFKEGDVPNNQFVFNLHLDSGQLCLVNGSQKGDFFHCGAFGCAFWIEEISENWLRFHCNDHESDDDFDDLIFDMEFSDL